jgi:hypothetical protein
MSVSRKPKFGKYLQLRTGVIFHYSESLAKGKGVFEVSRQVAADWFREQGVTNDLTNAYPLLAEMLSTASEETDEPEPAALKPKPIRRKKSPAGKLVSAAPELRVSDKPATPQELQDMIDGNTDSG